MLAAAKRRLHAEDHYYWVTSYLAARGLQRATCRLIAFSTLGLSAVSLLMMLSDLGPAGTFNRWLAAGISVGCILIASLWLRSGWPTRLQSQLGVGIGCIFIAVACLIQGSPGIGFTGVSTFIMVSSFTALFHDGRLLAYTWLVGAATLVALAVRLDGFEPAVTVAGIALFVLINSFVLFICRNVIRLANTGVHYGELEPLTGLLTREAFTDRVAAVIPRDRDDDRFLAVVVISLDSFSLLTAMKGDGGANEARVAIGHRLSGALRRDAVLAHVGESEYLVADTFKGTNASVLTERLQHSIRTAPYRLTASIGVVVTPLIPLVGHPPHDVVEELITIAASNAYTARRNGGQRTEATTAPRLTSLEDVNSNDWDNDDLSA